MKTIKAVFESNATTSQIEKKFEKQFLQMPFLSNFIKWFVTTAESLYENALKDGYDLEYCESLDELKKMIGENRDEWYQWFIEEAENSGFDSAAYLNVLMALNETSVGGFGTMLANFFAFKLKLAK